MSGGSGASSSNFATIKDEIHAIRHPWYKSEDGISKSVLSVALIGLCRKACAYMVWTSQDDFLIAIQPCSVSPRKWALEMTSLSLIKVLAYT